MIIKLLTVSADAIKEVGEGAGCILALATSKMPGPHEDKRCGGPDVPCEIPEQQCPPRCVCELTWDATQGEELRALIRVRNVSGTARTFAIESTELIGPGGSLGAISIAPAQLALAPGASGVVEGALTVPADSGKGRYEAEIQVQGAYEQCVRTVIKIVGKKMWPHGHPAGVCDLEQGDPPVRIRAHHWYDHFQCTEPCDVV